MAEQGTLCQEARWILRTRLIYLTKPGSHKPRPIRVGEFLRSTVCKRMLAQDGRKLVPIFLRMHQWGVQMPGGAEALVHWRSTVETLALEGDIEALVAFDLDLTNMYGSIEWPSIRAAVAKNFARAAN